MSSSGSWLFLILWRKKTVFDFLSVSNLPPLWMHVKLWTAPVRGGLVPRSLWGGIISCCIHLHSDIRVLVLQIFDQPQLSYNVYIFELSLSYNRPFLLEYTVRQIEFVLVLGNKKERQSENKKLTFRKSRIVLPDFVFSLVTSFFSSSSTCTVRWEKHYLEDCCQCMNVVCKSSF